MLKSVLLFIILVQLAIVNSCAPKEACHNQNYELLNLAFAIKVDSLYYKNHNEIVTGRNVNNDSKEYPFWGFSPHLSSFIESGDVFIKNKNSKFYCVIKESNYFIFFLDCNNFNKSTRLFKFERKINININKKYFIDSTGLYLVDTLQ